MNNQITDTSVESNNFDKNQNPVSVIHQNETFENDASFDDDCCEQLKNNTSHVSPDGVLTPCSRASSLTSSSSSSSSLSQSSVALPNPSVLGDILHFNDLIHKNKRFNIYWSKKKIEDVYPVLSDTARLESAAVGAKATYITELR
jgi:hypothetical protein